MNDPNANARTLVWGITALILLACSPAVVIAVWKLALTL